MSNWISVDDKLPEDECEVLCIDKDCEYYLAYYSDDHWRETTNCTYIHDITHWMLPEPPGN